jgi:hypothetical protein
MDEDLIASDKDFSDIHYSLQFQSREIDAKNLF